MRKRTVLIAVLAFVLFGVGYVAWTLADLPPVRFLLRYGLSPGCEPTGETMILEGVEFVEIGPGIFRMGSTHLAEGGDWLGRLCAPFGLPWGRHPEPSCEMPVHWVEFRRSFWIAKTEITNSQYARFEREHTPVGRKMGPDHPVLTLSLSEAKRYCAWLSEKSGLTVRVPSEAEWECACRAGSDAEFGFGNDETELTEYGWFAANSERDPHPVAKRRPNRWGLYDMHGNVWEWCADSWRYLYTGAPTDGSARIDERPPSGVLRGGCWHGSAEECRSASREEPFDLTPGGGISFFVPSTPMGGLRPVIAASEEQ